MQVRMKPLAALCFAIGLLTVTNASAVSGKPAVDNNTLVVALSAGPGNLDPQVAPSVDSAKFAWNVFDTLYGFDRKGNLEPRLATTHTVSADGLTHTFKLRSGVKFHNNAVLTSDDVKYSLERIIKPETKSTRRPYFADLVTGIETPDAQTVVFKLAQRDGAFLHKVAGYLYIVPKAYTQSLPNPEAFALAPIGTGPYRVGAHKIGQSLELTRFDGFWGDKPAISKLLLRFIPEASSRVNALQAGEIDLAADVAPIDIERLRNDKKFTIESVPGGSPVFVRIYSNDPATPFSKRDVRLALNYALDKDALIKNVYRGQAAPLASHIPSSYPYGSNKSLKPFAYDPALAKKLLTDAGYPKGFDTSLFCTSPTFERAFCEAIAAYWGQVGIRTQIRIVDSAASNRLNNTHQSGPLFISGFGNAIYEPIHVIGGSVSKTGTWSDYYNPDVQKLIDKVEGEGDQAKRAALFDEIVKLARDDGQAVLIAEPEVNYVKDPALDWKPQIAGWSLNFRNVTWNKTP